MSVVIVTGSAGLIGSEAVLFFTNLGFDVVGIDNDLRAVFFGEEASTQWNHERIQRLAGAKYTHYYEDIRDNIAIENIFKKYQSAIALVIHTAAQPSHDWSALDPQIDFAVNANGTLNLLQATRNYTPEAVFIFTSTNKVYGTGPNKLPFQELETRWEIDPTHYYYGGIGENMTIDQSLHSLFGVSKLTADLLTQEYGHYFGLKTGCFRCGCLTGPYHAGSQMQGFLAYLVKCVATQQSYTVFGYKGKQVRDNIHSRDLIEAFYQFYQNPISGEVFNIGGGRFSNCSVLEAIQLSEQIVGQELNWTYSINQRRGDHKWWITDNRKFQNIYPNWSITATIEDILTEIYEYNKVRWTTGKYEHI